MLIVNAFNALTLHFLIAQLEYITAWQVPKYGGFSGPYFPAFGPEKPPFLDIFHAVYVFLPVSVRNVTLKIHSMFL